MNIEVIFRILPPEMFSSVKLNEIKRLQEIRIRANRKTILKLDNE